MSYRALLSGAEGLVFYLIPSCCLIFVESFAATNSWDCIRHFIHSALFIRLISSIKTHLCFARYGAGLKPGRLQNSSKSSSLTLNDAVVGDSLSPTTQNILPPTENTRLLRSEER